jgi:hypothetical protein
MTRREGKSEVAEIKALLSADGDFLRSMVRSAVQAALEADMTETLSAEPSERADERGGYRSGSYSRSLISRVGTIELRAPRDRPGLFSTELFDAARWRRYQAAPSAQAARRTARGKGCVGSRSPCRFKIRISITPSARITGPSGKTCQRGQHRGAQAGPDQRFDRLTTLQVP